MAVARDAACAVPAEAEGGVNTVPDRPFATRTDAELDAAIALNLKMQASFVGSRTDDARRQLSQLKSRCAELVNERNMRDDMRNLPF